MPSVPSGKKCNFLGCKEAPIFGTASCAKHGGRRSERYKTNEKLYNSAAWKNLRAVKRSEFPICAACLLNGIVTETAHIDHVIPHKQDEDRFMVNLFQGLCQPCHTNKTLLERKGIFRHYTAMGPVDYTDADYNQLVIPKFHSEI